MAEIENGHVRVGRRALSASVEEIKDLEAGVPASGSGRIHRPAVMRAVQMGGAKMWPTYPSLGVSVSSRSTGSAARFFCEDEGHHFLDACFLCKKPLGGHRDIFMYRGDTPFCSEECRQEQIDMDEEEKNWANLPMKASTSRKEQNPNATEAIQVRAAGAIVAG